jgi:hypothetical protein
MIQRKFELMGKSGCYFFCLLHFAESVLGHHLDAELVYDKAIASGWMGEDCFIKDAAAILAYLLGGQWSVTWQPAGYALQLNETAIQRWELRFITGTKTHFTLVDWDPYGDSQTRREGKVADLRIIKKIGG